MTFVDQGRLVALAGSVERGELDPVDMVDDSLERIGQDPLHAWSWLDPSDARSQAERVRARLRSGERLLLAGVTIGIKDNLCFRDQPCTCGSRVLEGYRAPYTATAVERLVHAGAVILGRTNMDEFAMGSSTEYSAYGPTLHPLDPSRVPGGSSGGSAVAVAASHVPGALGSDTGGSVRQPAAFCGVAAMKATYGRISRYGLVAFASSLDHIGPFGRNVADVARLLRVMAGPDPRDSTCADRPVDDYEGACSRDIRGLRVGLVELQEQATPLVQESVERAARSLEAAGAILSKVELPSWNLGIPCYYVLAPAEASSNLARYDGLRYGPAGAIGDPGPFHDILTLFQQTRSRFGPEVRRRILMGTFVLSAGYQDAYYLRAQALRRRIRGETLRVLSELDALLLPTTPSTAFALGERSQDPVSMYLSDICTVPANLAGVPALSVPVPASGALPVGVQLIGRPWEESLLLALGAAVERAS